MSVALKQQPAPELRVEVIEGRDAFLGLERAWNEALGKGPRDEPMLRHEWLRAWIENFAPSLPLRTFVARDLTIAQIKSSRKAGRPRLFVEIKIGWDLCKDRSGGAWIARVQLKLRQMSPDDVCQLWLPNEP